MKKLENLLWGDRNNWHYVKGALTALVMYFVAFQAYHTLARFAVAIVTSGICAVAWEVLRNYRPDWNDIKRDVIGAVIMCAIIAIVLMFTCGFVTDGFKF